jgi:hypothetical protein
MDDSYFYNIDNLQIYKKGPDESGPFLFQKLIYK